MLQREERAERIGSRNSLDIASEQIGRYPNDLYRDFSFGCGRRTKVT